MKDSLVIVLFIFIVLADLFTGLAKSLVPDAKRHANSTKGLNGVVRHVLIVALVLMFYPFMEALGFSTIADMFGWYFVAQYGISILENLEVLGIPFPPFIKDRFEKMAQRDDKLIDKAFDEKKGK